MKKRYPYWVRVSSDYNDEGSTFKCLHCYSMWSGYNAPGIIKYGIEPLKIPIYTRIWKFCPYCGIEWIGQKTLSTPDNPYGYGLKRIRREIAMSNYKWSKPTHTLTFWQMERWNKRKKIWEVSSSFGGADQYIYVLGQSGASYAKKRIDRFNSNANKTKYRAVLINEERPNTDPKEPEF